MGAGATPWPAMEQLCEDLGADCHCSEPLDDDKVDTDTPLDPDNTTTSDKECIGQGSTGSSNDDTIGFTDGSNSPFFVTTTAMTGAPYNFPALPTGTSIVDYIMIDDVAGQMAVKAEYGVVVHDSTFCRRHYFVLHEDMKIDYRGLDPDPGSGDEDRIKMSRAITKSGATTIQHHESEFQWGSFAGEDDAEYRSYENTIEAGGAGWGAWSPNNWSSGLTLADMKDSWWRMEHCWDHDDSGTSNKLHHRIRLYGPLSAPATYTAPTQISGNAKTGGIELGNSHSNWIIDGYRQTNGRLLQSGMYSGFTAAMARDGAYDPTYWPGCATEIEGEGC